MAITAGSTVALALLRTAEELRLHSQFATGLNLRCGEYLIYVSRDPRGAACGLQVDADDLALLRTPGEWRWDGQGLIGRRPGHVVGLDSAIVGYRVAPPVVRNLAGDPDRLVRARAAVGGASWFDTGPGHEVGLPRLRAAIERLVTAAPDAAAAVRSVVGMGVGLTPSADDALIGALCILAAVGAPVPEVGRQVCAWLRSDGAGATTDVSANYLRLAFEGAFSVPLIRTVAALADDVPADVLAGPLRGLSAVGATSGMDAAVGVQMVWQSLVPALTPVRS